MFLSFLQVLSCVPSVLEWPPQEENVVSEVFDNAHMFFRIIPVPLVVGTLGVNVGVRFGVKIRIDLY